MNPDATPATDAAITTAPPVPPTFGLSVRAVIRHDPEGTVLLLRRPPGAKHFAGLWEFPGGKTDPGESFDGAVLREIKEESGLEAVMEHAVGQAQGEVKGKRIVYLFMQARVRDVSPLQPPVALSDEHVAHRWVTLADLVQLASAKDDAADQMVPHFKDFAVEYARQHGFTTAKPKKSESTVPTPEFVAAQVEKYRPLQPLYEQLGKALEDVLEPVRREICPMGRVEWRAKKVPSFAGKILRKGHYADPVNEMTDLCGVRVITQIDREVQAVCDFIREHFEIDEKNSEDKLIRLRAGEFGYRSVHYVVQFKKSKFPHVPAELLPLKAEIQVRTLLQHAWADIGHDRLYKGEFPTPPRYQRESARIAALLEDSDAAFQRLVDGLENYECHYGAYLAPEQMEQRIAVQRAILEHDVDNAGERLRLVRLLMAQEKWDVAAQEARALPAEKRTADLWSCLGDALRHQHQPGEPGWQEARDAYAQAIVRDDGHREARIGMAETESDQLAKLRLYDAAYHLNGDDPATLSGYVRQKIKVEQCADFIPLLRPNFEAAIKRCLLQVEVGVDLPWSFFRIGGFRMLLGGEAVWQAYDALARAIRCTDKVQSLMETACEAATELVSVEPGREGAEAARRFLLAGILAKFPTSQFAETAKLLATPDVAPITGPVVIVAGGCDPAHEKDMLSHRALLAEAFSGFSGTVISGGTEQGIAGMVGALGADPAGHIRTLGYLSEELPPDKTATIDNRYHEHRRTAGTREFSVLEPLQNWLDLLVSGIKPENVCVLGINGGRIAAFEYRLAWALGANVAMLQNTGREADKFEADIQTGDYQGMLVLPRDPMSVQAFLRGETWTPALLAEGTRERLARMSHAKFLEDNRHKHSDPAMQPWETLREDLCGSNLDQVNHMVRNLQHHGFHVISSAPGDPLFQFTDADRAAMESMARYEHGRWNVERIRQGWRYGPVRDPENKRSPHLVSWEELPDGVRKWDRDVVARYPLVLAEAGLTLERSGH